MDQNDADFQSKRHERDAGHDGREGQALAAEVRLVEELRPQQERDHHREPPHERPHGDRQRPQRAAGQHRSDYRRMSIVPLGRSTR